MLTPVVNICRWRSFHDSTGKSFFKSASVCLTFLPLDSPQRCAKRGCEYQQGRAGLPKRLTHHHTGCFVPNARQLFERFDRIWDLTCVLLHQNFGKVLGSPWLFGVQVREGESQPESLPRSAAHRKWVVRQFPKRRSNLVHHLVGALGAQQHGNQ